MKHFLQNTIALLTLIVGVQVEVRAQQQVVPAMDQPGKVAVAKAPAREIELTANQMWYGYYKGTERLVGMGVPAAGNVNEMIFIDGNDPVVKGKTMKAVRFRVQGVSDLSNVTVWLAAEMPYPASEGHIMTMEVDQSTMQDTVFTEVPLSEDYVVPEEGVFVGYSYYNACTTHESEYSVLTTADRTGPDGCMYDWEDAFMSGWQWYGGRMGKLAIQVLLEGNFAANAATAADFGDHIVLAGESLTVPLELTNSGAAGISSFDYQVYTNGTPGVERHVDLAENFAVMGGKTYANITLDADPDFAKAQKRVVITRVNGQPNEQIDEPAAVGTLITLAQASPRRTLIEEYTGTWCGYCPRGTIGLRKLHQDFGDQIVAVSIHTDDPMAILGYQPIYQDVRSYPLAFFNREYSADPYGGSLLEDYGAYQDVAWQQSLPTEAALKLSARWSNDLQTRIAVTATSTFQYASADADYGLAYVVVEDGLQCDTTGWEQRNFFTYFADWDEYAPGTQAYEDFKDYLSAEEYVEGVIYDDVAVAAYNIVDGVNNSVPAPIAVGEEKTHNYTISIANNAIIQDKSKLRVVAILIERASGRLVNAAIASILSDTDGIAAGTIQHDGPTTYYGADGRQHKQTVSGLNIVRRPDGTTTKLIVR